MPEENTKTNTSAENIENNAAQAAADTAVPKTYTQDDMDRVVEARLKRERNRVAKEYASFDQYKQIFSALKENGIVKSDDPNEAVNVIKQFYAKGDGEPVGEPSVKETPKSAETLSKDEKMELIESVATKKAAKLSEDELEDEIQSLREKGKRRSDEEDVKLSVYSKKLGEITVKKTNQKWLDEFKAQYPKVNLEDLRADTGFTEFLKLSKAPLAETYKTYLAIRGDKPADKKDLGSVASTGSAIEDATFTKAEVERMTPDEVKKNYSAIMKSVPKWST